MPSLVDAETNKDISQLIKQAVPEIHKEGDEVRLAKGKALFFDLNLSILSGEKVFCLQMQIKLKSCVTLFS